MQQTQSKICKQTKSKRRIDRQRLLLACMISGGFVRTPLLTFIRGRLSALSLRTLYLIFLEKRRVRLFSLYRSTRAFRGPVASLAHRLPSSPVSRTESRSSCSCCRLISMSGTMHMSVQPGFCTSSKFPSQNQIISVIRLRSISAGILACCTRTEHRRDGMSVIPVS
jgi:hypothetical protein